MSNNYILNLWNTLKAMLYELKCIYIRTEENQLIKIFKNLSEKYIKITENLTHKNRIIKHEKA